MIRDPKIMKKIVDADSRVSGGPAGRLPPLLSTCRLPKNPPSAHRASEVNVL